ncbi:hypothetical protein [Luteolibacter sp. LG18]|uniref:pectate lyase family protein n=1 Tax=Luteolibacter sp. LG18 TaxID=2819286 RepID=UPI0030C6B596
MITRSFAMFLVSALPALAGKTAPGFASVEAYGMKGTTGGGDAAVVTVRTAEELQQAVERLDVKDKRQRDTTPRVIRLAGDIDLAPLANEKPGHEIKQVGVVKPRSNTTLEGPPGGACLKGGIVELKGVSNVILRNVKFEGPWEFDPTGEYDQMGWDCVRVTNSGQTRSHHIWVDHCDFGRVYDGQLDIVHGSDLVTISWCHFHGAPDAPQKKGLLFGSSSSEKAVANDRGRINVTIDHCWFQDIKSRSPRLRAGNVHVANSLVEHADSGTISVTGGATRVEHSVYRDCKVATTWSHADDSVAKGRAGRMILEGNLRLPEGTKPGHEWDFTNSPGAFAFNAPEWSGWNDLTKPPYTLPLEKVEAVEELVRKGAGVK